MTDRHAKTAKDIMDNACLPPAFASVDAALRVSIEQALRDERREALEEAARLFDGDGDFQKAIASEIRSLIKESDDGKE